MRLEAQRGSRKFNINPKGHTLVLEEVSSYSEIIPDGKRRLPGIIFAGAVVVYSLAILFFNPRLGLKIEINRGLIILNSFLDFTRESKLVRSVCGFKICTRALEVC